MPYVNTNNDTFEGYNFTEEFIEAFSRATLQAGRKNGLLEAISSAKSAADNEEKVAVNFHFSLPEKVIGVARITKDEGPHFKAIVKFFSVDILAPQIDNGSFDEHSAIAFLQFDFDAFGLDLLERKMESARIFVRDGSADQMFVTMVLKDDPKAFSE